MYIVIVLSSTETKVGTKEGTLLICNAIQTVAPRQIYMPQSQSVMHPVINSELRI